MVALARKGYLESEFRVLVRFLSEGLKLMVITAEVTPSFEGAMSPMYWLMLGLKKKT